MQKATEINDFFRLDFAREDLGRDEDLWNSIKAGNEKAFEKFFRLYYTRLLNYGTRLNKDEDDVKDCIQNLLLTIWESRERLGNCTNIENYLLASLRRLIIRRVKVEYSFQRNLDIRDIDFLSDLSHESQLIKDQGASETIAALQNAIEKLPPRQKEALYLKFYSNQSYADIAEIMDISTRAVYKLVHKSLESLNKDLGTKDSKISYFLSIFL